MLREGKKLWASGKARLHFYYIYSSTREYGWSEKEEKNKLMEALNWSLCSSSSPSLAFRAIPHHHIFLSTHRPLLRWTREASNAKRQIYALIIYEAFNYNAALGKYDEIILASAFVVAEAIIPDDAATTVKNHNFA